MSTKIEKSIKVQYFSVLREKAGVTEETIESTCNSPADLYDWAAARYGFSIPRSSLGIAVNGDWGGWDVPLVDGDEVVFIPPVSGG